MFEGINNNGLLRPCFAILDILKLVSMTVMVSNASHHLGYHYVVVFSFQFYSLLIRTTKGPLSSRLMEASLILSELLSIVILAITRLTMFEIQMDHIAYSDNLSADTQHLQTMSHVTYVLVTVSFFWVLATLTLYTLQQKKHLLSRTEAGEST